MEPTDLTIEILKGIRDEGRKTNERVDETNKRLDETNVRLDSMREELSRRIVESEIRTATAITALSGEVRELTSFVGYQSLEQVRRRRSRTQEHRSSPPRPFR